MALWKSGESTCWYRIPPPWTPLSRFQAMPFHSVAFFLSTPASVNCSAGTCMLCKLNKKLACRLSTSRLTSWLSLLWSEDRSESHTSVLSSFFKPEDKMHPKQAIPPTVNMEKAFPSPPPPLANLKLNSCTDRNGENDIPRLHRLCGRWSLFKKCDNLTACWPSILLDNVDSMNASLPPTATPEVSRRWW